VLIQSFLTNSCWILLTRHMSTDVTWSMLTLTTFNKKNYFQFLFYIFFLFFFFIFFSSPPLPLADCRPAASHRWRHCQPLVRLKPSPKAAKATCARWRGSSSLDLARVKPRLASLARLAWGHLQHRYRLARADPTRSSLAPPMKFISHHLYQSPRSNDRLEEGGEEWKNKKINKNNNLKKYYNIIKSWPC